MKTTIKIRLFAITVLMAAIVAGNNFEANAQHRDSRNDKKETKRESSSYNKSFEKSRNDHSRNDRNDREIRSYSDTRRYGDAKQNDVYRRHENERRESDQDRYRGNNNSHNDWGKSDQDRYKGNRKPHNDWGKYEKPVYHKPYDSNYRHAEHRDIYVHPKFGRTYRKFYSNPFVFRHNHGRYYYYDGHFCDYRPGIGYVIVDIPYLTVFTELPFRCTRIRLFGNTYYQYGNLYFEPLSYGYRLVPSPLQVHISARF